MHVCGLINCKYSRKCLLQLLLWTLLLLLVINKRTNRTLKTVIFSTTDFSQSNATTTYSNLFFTFSSFTEKTSVFDEPKMKHLYSNNVNRLELFRTKTYTKRWFMVDSSMTQVYFMQIHSTWAHLQLFNYQADFEPIVAPQMQRTICSIYVPITFFHIRLYATMEPMFWISFD